MIISALMFAMMHLSTIPLAYLPEFFPFLRPVVVEVPLELLLMLAEFAQG